MTPDCWWIWVVAGIFLILLEIFTPGFLIMWFGVAACITAIPVYMGSPLESIIITYGVSVLLLTIFGRKIFLHIANKYKTDIDTNINAIINTKGVVTEEIEMTKGTGRVRVGKEIWTAIVNDDTPLPVNSMVRVVNVQGSKLVVRKEND